MSIFYALAAPARRNMDVGGYGPRLARSLSSGRPQAEPVGLAGTTLRICSQPQLFLALAERAQPQGIELDEARGIAVIVSHRTFLEGDEILIVQRILALAADHDDISLVEFQAHPTGDIGLAVIDRRLQHLALRREPEAVVDEIGIFRHQLVLEMSRTAIERDRFDAAMRHQQNGAARRLVYAPRLHADETVFHQILSLIH